LNKDNSDLPISPNTPSATPNPPSTNPDLRTAWASLFNNAFSPNQRHLQQQPPAPDDAPNEACGDTMDPGFAGLHVWSSNLNTLSLSNDLSELHELCTHFQTYNVGIAALQEINLDLTQTKIYTKIKAVFDEHFNKQCTIICSSTPIRAETSWKPGSTMLVIMPQWTPYVINTKKDALGRWCSATLQVKAQREIVFYSFYNCCKTRIQNAGLHTMFAQQWHILRRRGDLDPDPQVQAVHDLSVELTAHTTAKRSLCIVGDFNDSLGEDPSLMAHICYTHNLLDILDHQHPDAAHIPSYARSANRLDYAILSRNLVNFVTTSGLNHYHAFYPSDHHPLFVGFDDTLFGPRPAITSARTCYVHSNAANVKLFIGHAYKHLQDTGTFWRLRTFEEALPTLTDDATALMADSIDEQITRALLSADLKCKKPIKAPWSDTLHYTSLQVKY
jgi:hypothetical protein